MYESQYVIEDVTNPDDIARFRAQDARHRRNSEWLQTHWARCHAHRHAASLWRWQDKKRSLPTRLLRHGHGLMRCTQRTMERWSGIYALRKGHASMRIVGEWQLCDDGVM